VAPTTPMSRRPSPEAAASPAIRRKLGVVLVDPLPVVRAGISLLVDGRPVSACTTLAFEVRDRSVMTIEGLADGGKLHPLQEAFIEYGGFQCGFCTPGMILAAKALLDENPNPSEDELKHFMHGNICRCTGYKKIIESIMAAAKKMRAGY